MMEQREYIPMIRDASAYAQKHNSMVLDEACAIRRSVSFLTDEEEAWYQQRLDAYRKEFGLKPCDD